MEVNLKAVGIIAPGLETWQHASEVFCGEKIYQKAEVGKFTPNLLRPNERRRTTALIKLALQVAEQAMQQSQLSAEHVCSVFASCEGDTDIVNKICDALTLPDKPVSPTQFHNSVHNAPAGYWAIATHSQLPSTSLSGGKFSFAAGLLEAASLTIAERHPVLLVCYDYPAPQPLKNFVGITEPFGCALLLDASSDDSVLAKLTLEVSQELNENNMPNNELEQLRYSNPAARGLPLLQAVAENKAKSVVLNYTASHQLGIHCTPC